MTDARSRTIVDFVRSDPLLYSTYLLHNEGQKATRLDSAESCYAFLLWFFARGRSAYMAPLLIPDAVKAAVTAPDRSLCHPLMPYVAGLVGLSLQGDDLRAWYYLDAMPRYGLSPFLSRAELGRLGGKASGLDTRTDLERLRAMFRPTSPLPPGGDTFGELLSRLASASAGSPDLPAVSIVGLHRSVLGLGEDARCLFECLIDAGIRCELVDVSPKGFPVDDRADRYRPFEAAHPSAPVLVFCLPPFEMMRAIASRAMTRPSRPQYRIGYWPWETTALIDNWAHVYDFVDEVWASSRFLVEAYAAGTDKPIVHMPLHVRVDRPVIPQDLKPLFGGGFVVLSIFDFNSRIERKNPLGAIAAFRKAFPSPNANVQLLLKTINADMQPESFATVEKAIAGDDRIIIVDGPLPRAELCGLITMADAYLSLHRSEGFGRPLAEAMLLGTPVVATQWSGSADFLTEETGYPVRSSLRPVERHEYAFAAGLWAEPDVEHAAEMLRRLFDGRDREPITRNARRFVEETFGRKAIAARLRAHFYDRFARLPGPL